MLDESVAAQIAANNGLQLEILSINVPADLKSKIIEGKYVEMSQLLEKSLLEKKVDPNLCFVQDEQGRFILKEKKPKVGLQLARSIQRGRLEGDTRAYYRPRSTH